MYKNLCIWALSGDKEMVDETSLKEILELASVTGYEGIEIRIETVSQLVQEKSLDYVKSLFSEPEIIPAGWELAGQYWKGDYPYSWRSDEERYQRLLEKLPLFAKVSQDKTISWLFYNGGV